MKAWLISLRLRTLPLAIAVVSTGAVMAYEAGTFQWKVYLLTLLTAALLQVLSNLANEYGDFEKGTDNEERQGPIRSMQEGKITKRAMLRAMAICGGLAFVSGVYLLYAASLSQIVFWTFIGLGVVSILGAIFYTYGKSAYGYKGLGDLSVFLFFGLIGVAGSYYLFTKSLDQMIWLPAIAVGLFSTAVLNVNNVRDMDNDKSSGKITLAVLLGKQGAIRYHYALLALGWLAAVVFTLINYKQMTDWLFLLITPLLILNANGVRRDAGKSILDPKLKQMVLSTLLFVILFSIGIVLRG